MSFPESSPQQRGGEIHTIGQVDGYERTDRPRARGMAAMPGREPDRAYAGRTRHRVRTAIKRSRGYIRLFMHFLQAERIRQGVIAPEPDTHRAINMEAMNKFIGGNRVRDFIALPENRNMPDSLASGIL